MPRIKNIGRHFWTMGSGERNFCLIHKKIFALGVNGDKAGLVLPAERQRKLLQHRVIRKNNKHEIWVM